MRIISGTARGRAIEAPAGRNTRPTLDRVRENLFNMLQTEVPGARVLDLFAGSGALSLEALSRGAEWAVLADSDRLAHACQLRNLERLGIADRADVLLCPWQAAIDRLRKAGDSFDLVFLDPPYRMNDLRDVFEGITPLLAREALIVCEHQADHPPDVPASFALVRKRNWGFCGVSLYRPHNGRSDGEEDKS